MKYTRNHLYIKSHEKTMRICDIAEKLNISVGDVKRLYDDVSAVSYKVVRENLEQ